MVLATPALAQFTEQEVIDGVRFYKSACQNGDQRACLTIVECRKQIIDACEAMAEEGRFWLRRHTAPAAGNATAKAEKPEKKPAKRSPKRRER